MCTRNMLTVAVSLLLTALLYSQEKLKLEDLSESERKSIEAIALYPEEIRTAVLEITAHPPILIKIKRLQAGSQEDFQELISTYPRETQELIWDLSRFDGLMDQLAMSDRSARDLEEITKSYPTQVADQVRHLEAQDFETIAELVHLQLVAEEAARKIVDQEDPQLQASFNLLLDNPEVLSIMCDELELAILVGNLYVDNPGWVLRKADSLHLELAAQNSRALEEWKSEVADDPEAQKELVSTFEEYEGSYPFDDVYYDDSQFQGAEDEDQVINRISLYYMYHYPFWFGYPYWYDYPRWRPYPVWYDWGFYPFAHRRVIIFGLPHYHVVWWYFNKPQHHYKYTHLSQRFIDHYRSHREFGGGISSAVNRWQYQNREVMSDEVLASRDLPKKLKLFGEMEENRIKYNQKNPAKQLTSAQYSEKYVRKYEPIKPRTPARKVEEKMVPREQIIKEIKRAPARTTQKKTVEKKTEIRKVDRAKEYHRNQTVKKAPPPKTSPRSKTIKPAEKKQTAKRKTS